MLKRRALKLTVCIITLVVGMMLIAQVDRGNSSGKRPGILAHRGLAQTFDDAVVDNDTCTAAIINPPDHQFIENTIASIKAAFAVGSDVVEIDIQSTSDGKFVIFHDLGLNCRTDGSGVTRQHSLAYLQSLDVGYGYTFDNGKSFPFRGKGKGLMPSLTEVLNRFPEGKFLINVKSGSEEEAELLVAFIRKLDAMDRNRLAVYGKSSKTADLIREKNLLIRTLSQEDLSDCLIAYMAIGWLYTFPDKCKNQLILVPSNMSGVLWGWPHRFVEMAHKNNSEVVLTGPYTGRKHIPAIDNLHELDEIPEGFEGLVWTNRAHLIGERLKQRSMQARVH